MRKDGSLPILLLHTGTQWNYVSKAGGCPARGRLTNAARMKTPLLQRGFSLGNMPVLQMGTGKYRRLGKGKSMENKLRVGVIASTHGIRGEVKVFPTTDDAARFRKIKKVVLDAGKEELELEIEGVKFFKKFAILKFKGIDNINDIEKYKGKELYVRRENAQKLGRDEYFVGDLIGIKVAEDTGRVLGILKDVMETGANDVYVVEMENHKELLIPAIRQCILNVDVEAGEMEVHLLEGLLE